MADLTFHDVLAAEGIAPADLTVILHSPGERLLQAVLPSLVKTRRAAMEAYQATHSPGAEAALRRGRPWVAAFVKVGQDVPSSHSRMLFAGLYRNSEPRERTYAEIMADPEVRFLHETFGTHHEMIGRDPNRTWTWFDMQLDPRMEALQGRLVLSVRLTPNYVRRGEKLEARVRAIHEMSTFDADPPDWRDWVLDAKVIRAIPPGWAARLREWRGIYLICDRSDGARYVGSAYGETNLLGRWITHVEGDAGVTAQLAARDPAGFRFSILERLAPDMAPRDVIAIEHGWMTRLQTREYGLNT